jgi:hypothetical protein
MMDAVKYTENSEGVVNQLLGYPPSFNLMVVCSIAGMLLSHENIKLDVGEGSNSHTPLDLSISQQIQSFRFVVVQ